LCRRLTELEGLMRLNTFGFSHQLLRFTSFEYRRYSHHQSLPAYEHRGVVAVEKTALGQAVIIDVTNASELEARCYQQLHREREQSSMRCESQCTVRREYPLVGQRTDRRHK